MRRSARRCKLQDYRQGSSSSSTTNIRFLSSSSSVEASSINDVEDNDHQKTQRRQVVVTTTTTTTATNERQGLRRSSRIPKDGLTLDDFVSSSSSASSRINSNNNKQQLSNSSSSPKLNGLSFSIKTYGCQMNVNDTDIVRSILLDAGFHEKLDGDGGGDSENDDPDANTPADIWLTNTCAIRDKAEQKVWQRLHTLKNKKAKMNNTSHGKKQNQQQTRRPVEPIVGLLGCMAERLQEELLEKDMADMVVGPDAYRDIPRLINTVLQQRRQLQRDASNGGVISSDEDNEYEYDYDEPIGQAINVQLSLDETYADIFPKRSSTINAAVAASTTTHNFTQSSFVSIQRGCSNRCSFCIVPFTRGVERSRPYDSILNEIRQLIEQDNIKEVVLLGQNVNSYHDQSPQAMLARPLKLTNEKIQQQQQQDDDGSVMIPRLLSNDGFKSRGRSNVLTGGYYFVDLVDDVSNLHPELRVRFTSPHPKDYPTPLLELMAERSNVCNQLHLPAQSGSTRMLKRMKRGYTREAYLELIDSVHDVMGGPSNVALSSDFIAGFCGETDADHEDTVSLLQQVQYDQAYLFAYSLRDKTHAARTMIDDVPAHIKQQRLQELIDTFRTTIHAKNEKYEVGQLRLVLVEGPSKKKNKKQNDEDDGETISTTTSSMWHGRTDQNKRILFPVLDNDSTRQKTVLEERLGTSLSTLVMDDSWIETCLKTMSSLGNHNHGKDGALHQLSSWHPKANSIEGSNAVASLSPGDYAVVLVTEAKGHTLRGRVLWKTTLLKFDSFQTNYLTRWEDVQHVAATATSLMP